VLWAIALRTLRCDSNPVGHTANPEIALPCDCLCSVSRFCFQHNCAPVALSPTHLQQFGYYLVAYPGATGTAVEKPSSPVENPQSWLIRRSSSQLQGAEHALKGGPEGVEIRIRGYEYHIP
jgi:hypothetical protein